MVLNLIHKADVLEQAKEQTDVKAKERKKASESRTHAASVCVFPEWHSCPIPALFRISFPLPDPRSFGLAGFIKMCLSPATRQDLGNS